MARFDSKNSKLPPTSIFAEGLNRHLETFTFTFPHRCSPQGRVLAELLTDGIKLVPGEGRWDRLNIVHDIMLTLYQVYGWPIEWQRLTGRAYLNESDLYEYRVDWQARNLIEPKVNLYIQEVNECLRGGCPCARSMKKK